MAKMNENNPAAVFQRFGMRVNLDDPDVQSFMQTTGIPEAEWAQFDRTNPLPSRTQSLDEPQRARSHEIPYALRDLGVIGATKHQSGYDLYFILEFEDGGSFTYKVQAFDYEGGISVRRDYIADMVQKIQADRVLPFE